jgi:hypothetical protein
MMNMHLTFLGMTMIGLVGYLLDAGFGPIQKRVLWWRSSAQLSGGRSRTTTRLLLPWGEGEEEATPAPEQSHQPGPVSQRETMPG